MKAYVTSIGEKTTDICCDQLRKFGFDVVLLDEKMSWVDKYKAFIVLAQSKGENCLRVDADVIVNENIKFALKCEDKNKKICFSMAQMQVFDFYKNNLCIGQPMIYSKRTLDIIRENLDKIRADRPETSAWRMKGINDGTLTFDYKIYGIHGIGQSDEAMDRAERNKEDRGQSKEYDFELSRKLGKL